MEQLYNCVDVIELIAESVEVLNPQTVNVCWKEFWSEVVEKLQEIPYIQWWSRFWWLKETLVGKASDMSEEDVDLQRPRRILKSLMHKKKQKLQRPM